MLLAWLQVTFKAISDVLFLPHRLLAYEQKVCVRVGAGGGGCAEPPTWVHEKQLPGSKVAVAPVSLPLSLLQHGDRQ